MLPNHYDDHHSRDPNGGMLLTATGRLEASRAEGAPADRAVIEDRHRDRAAVGTLDVDAEQGRWILTHRLDTRTLSRGELREIIARFGAAGRALRDTLRYA